MHHSNSLDLATAATGAKPTRKDTFAEARLWKALPPEVRKSFF